MAGTQSIADWFLQDKHLTRDRNFTPKWKKPCSHRRIQLAKGQWAGFPEWLEVVSNVIGDHFPTGSRGRSKQCLLPFFPLESVYVKRSLLFRNILYFAKTSLSRVYSPSLTVGFSLHHPEPENSFKN